MIMSINAIAFVVVVISNFANPFQPLFSGILSWMSFTQFYCRWDTYYHEEEMWREKHDCLSIFILSISKSVNKMMVKSRRKKGTHWWVFKREKMHNLKFQERKTYNTISIEHDHKTMHASMMHAINGGDDKKSN